MVSDSFRVDASAASVRRPDGYRRSTSFLVDVLRFPAESAGLRFRDAGLRPGEARSFDSEGGLADQASAFCALEEGFCDREKGFCVPKPDSWARELDFCDREVDFCPRDVGFCDREADLCPRDVDFCVRETDSCGPRAVLSGRLPDGFEVRSVTVLVLGVVSVLSL